MLDVEARAQSHDKESAIRLMAEALPLMKAGSKWKLLLPSDLAFGDQGRQPFIKGGAPLVLELELVRLEAGSER